MSDNASTGRSIWYMRVQHREVEPPEETLVGVAGDDYPDGAVVDLVEHGPWPLGSPRIVRVRYVAETREIRYLRITPAWAPGLPAMRWVLLIEPAVEAGSAATLVAFPATEDTAGQVAEAVSFGTLGLQNTTQLGAVRWWSDTGLVDQIYVSPEFRRRRIAVALILAAAGVRVSRGWPALHGDGDRTELGQQWLAAGPSQWQHRFEPLRYLAPPMTPPATDSPPESTAQPG